jgi:hypothetical protein
VEKLRQAIHEHRQNRISVVCNIMGLGCDSHFNQDLNMGRINAKFLLRFQNDDLKQSDFLCSKTFKIRPKKWKLLKPPVPGSNPKAGFLEM